jgi:hypothetical protein
MNQSRLRLLTDFAITRLLDGILVAMTETEFSTS